MTPPREYLIEHYSRMWEAGIDRIRTGYIDIDPVLAAKVIDQRRGMTLAIRPSEPVRRTICGFLTELQKREPEQYYYKASELHVTFLSLFTATRAHEPFFTRQEEYVSAVDSIAPTLGSFSIPFEGITVSPAAIMVQGFIEDETLNEARDRLREALRARELTKGLDSRYRLVTAHMTIARFCHPLRDPEGFATYLEENRGLGFGVTEVCEAELVKNDWYMSEPTLEKVRRYRFPGM